MVRTRSGAWAMLDRESGEVMHPIGGPCSEAERLYVAASGLVRRLAEPETAPLVLLDVGLGAGSNVAAALRARASLASGGRPLRIVSIDRTLAALELALAGEHAEAFGWSGALLDAARTLVRDGAYSAPGLEWQLRAGDVFEVLAALAREPGFAADVVFWDPFSPGANPELWTLAAFRALFRVCRPGASVHTYSGATQVRSALLLAGFGVGIGDKIAEGKHATVAALAPARLEQPLDRRWLQRLERSTAPFPPDAPADALERVRALAAFAA
ncbi:MAG TPA: MnmC family methyltransferase [Polyangiaceae bacterium]|nr:MnmC family methyltransferase [Polyangiaceae bacterium]